MNSVTLRARISPSNGALPKAAPKAVRVAVLVNPSNVVNIALLKNVEAAAKKLGAKIQPVEAGTAPEIETGFAAMARQNAGALIVPLDSLFQQHISQIAALAAKQPTIFELALNVKTTKALGLKLPQAILIQATKVIESETMLQRKPLVEAGFRL